MSVITRHSGKTHSLEQDLKIVMLGKGGQEHQRPPEIVRLLKQLEELLCSGKAS